MQPQHGSLSPSPVLPPPHRHRPYSQRDRAVGQRLGRQHPGELQVAAHHLHLHGAAARRHGRLPGALGAPVVLTALGQRRAAAAAPQRRREQQQQQRGQQPGRPPVAVGPRRAAGCAAARGQHGGAVRGCSGPRSSRRSRGESREPGAAARRGLAPRGRCRHVAPGSVMGRGGCRGRAGAAAAAAPALVFVSGPGGLRAAAAAAAPPSAGVGTPRPEPPAGPRPDRASAAAWAASSAPAPRRLRGPGRGGAAAPGRGESCAASPESERLLRGTPGRPSASVQSGGVPPSQRSGGRWCSVGAVPPRWVPCVPHLSVPCSEPSVVHKGFVSSRASWKKGHPVPRCSMAFVAMASCTRNSSVLLRSSL